MKSTNSITLFRNQCMPQDEIFSPKGKIPLDSRSISIVLWQQGITINYHMLTFRRYTGTKNYEESYIMYLNPISCNQYLMNFYLHFINRQQRCIYFFLSFLVCIVIHLNHRFFCSNKKGYR